MVGVNVREIFNTSRFVWILPDWFSKGFRKVFDCFSKGLLYTSFCDHAVVLDVFSKGFRKVFEAPQKKDRVESRKRSKY